MKNFFYAAWIISMWWACAAGDIGNMFTLLAVASGIRFIRQEMADE